jgi:hypothetical protein
MLPSSRPQAQVHRGSKTKQHTSFFVRTLTWLIDGFLLASVGFMAQTLERAKMHCVWPRVEGAVCMPRSPLPHRGDRSQVRAPVTVNLYRGRCVIQQLGFASVAPQCNPSAGGNGRR